jgi:bacillopeptidase F (M6 metalloprotease family)
MFGFRGGESDEIVARKTGYRIDARRQWRGLTTADLSEIKNEEQLIEMVKVRCSLPDEKARTDVQSWMSGKRF